MRFLFSVALLCAAATAVPVSAQTPTVITSLTDALRIGEDNAARLRAADAGLAGAGGALIQADVRPNPELFVDAENFAGSKGYSGTQSLEWTAGLSQQIEIGGKREARISEARAGLEQAGHQRDLEALSFRADIARAYIRALAAARRVELADRQKENAATIASAVEARVEAGKEAAVQTQRADILRATAEMTAQRARGAYQASLAELGALLNRPAGSLRLQTGWLDGIGAVPDIAPDEASLAMNPKYALITAVIARARAGIAVATAAAVPDPTFRAGFRRYNDDDSSAIVVGVSVPIPVFDRNRGAILEARQSLIRAEAEQEAARLEILGELAKSRTAALTAYQQVRTLKSAVEPAADRALSAARDGYQTGKFDFLNLLDAQRTRFEIEEQLAAALEDYHLARIALTSLVGRVE